MQSMHAAHLQAMWLAHVLPPMWVCIWSDPWSFSWIPRSERGWGVGQFERMLQQHPTAHRGLRGLRVGGGGLDADANGCGSWGGLQASAATADCRLKRAGLDYWENVCVDVHPSWDAFYEYWQQQPGPKQLVGEYRPSRVAASQRAHFRSCCGFIICCCAEHVFGWLMCLTAWCHSPLQVTASLRSTTLLRRACIRKGLQLGFCLALR